MNQNPYKSIIVEDKEGELITISEGNKIQFCLETGEVKKGIVTKLQGKDEKLKIQIIPLENKTYEEIWSINIIADGSLKLDEEGEE